MAKKFRDLSEDQQEAFDENWFSQVKSKGFDTWDSPDDRDLISELKDTYGLCGSCEHFRFCRQEYGGITTNVRAYCKTFEIWNKGIAPVTDCNMFSERHLMTLEDMKEIGWILDMSTKEAGFHGMREVAPQHAKSIERQRRRKELKRNKQLGIE